jgi:chemotaxis protein CheZ
VLVDNDGHIGAIKSRLNDILMAQEFQDVTGQILQQVIELVTRLEDNLVQMLAVAGERIRHGGESRKASKDDTRAEGPAVPGADDSGRVNSQDEVDDLLSSLGF